MFISFIEYLNKALLFNEILNYIIVNNTYLLPVLFGQQCSFVQFYSIFQPYLRNTNDKI